MLLPISAIQTRNLSAAWMLVFMLSFAIVMLAIFPLILRLRKRKEVGELHKHIEEAKASILEDGVVKGPTGPRARHISWGRKT
jgi:flagellar biosynthesis/type III secretory pathway M-ring protein FliF/YscJ